MIMQMFKGWVYDIKSFIYRNSAGPLKQGEKPIFLCASADIGYNAVTSIFRDKKYLDGINKFLNRKGNKLIVSSEKPFAEVDKAKNKIGGVCSAIISNSGAYIKDCDGTIIRDEKIPEDVVRSLIYIMNNTEIESGIPLSGVGLFALQDLERSVAMVPCLSTVKRLLVKVKESGLARKLFFRKCNQGKIDIDNCLFNSMFNKTRSISFTFFPAQRADRKQDKLLPSQYYQADLKKYKRLMEGTLLKLMPSSKDSEDMKKAKMKCLENIDITITDNGINFVPKGYSKVEAFKTYCERKGYSADQSLFHGDSLSDFYMGVSLKGVYEEYSRAVKSGKEITAIEVFLKLCKLPFDVMNPEVMNHLATYYMENNKTYGTVLLEEAVKTSSAKYDKECAEKIKENRIEYFKVEQCGKRAEEILELYKINDVEEKDETFKEKVERFNNDIAKIYNDYVWTKITDDVSDPSKDRPLKEKMEESEIISIMRDYKEVIKNEYIRFYNELSDEEKRFPQVKSVDSKESSIYKIDINYKKKINDGIEGIKKDKVENKPLKGIGNGGIKAVLGGIKDLSQ